MKNKIKLKDILTELEDTYATGFSNKEILDDYLTEFDASLKKIAELIYSTKDENLKRQYKEALQHITMGFQILEGIRV